MRLLGDSVQEAYYQALVDAVDVPNPFSLAGLVAAVARQRGCEIILEPLPSSFGPEVSGMVSRTSAGYVMKVPVAAEAWWLRYPTCHELAHIVCNHVPGGTQMTSRLQDTVRAHSPIVRAAELDWGPLFRCDVSTDAEQEAEFVASLLVDRVERLAAGSPLAPPVPAGAIVDRFARVLGSRRDRRR